MQRTLPLSFSAERLLTRVAAARVDADCAQDHTGIRCSAGPCPRRAHRPLHTWGGRVGRPLGTTERHLGRGKECRDCAGTSDKALGLSGHPEHVSQPFGLAEITGPEARLERGTCVLFLPEPCPHLTGPCSPADLPLIYRRGN